MEKEIKFLFKLEDFISYQEYHSSRFKKADAGSYSDILVPLIPIAFIFFTMTRIDVSKGYIILSLATVFIYLIWLVKLFFFNKKRLLKFYKTIFENNYEQIIRINDEGIVIEDECSTDNIKWSGITRVDEYKNILIILLKHGRGIMIPENEIKSGLNDFIVFIKSKIKK